MIDQIVTDENAFEIAEALARDPESTAEQISAASAVLAQSPDPFHRILGRELRAGLFAPPGAEIKSVEAEAARGAQESSEAIERYLVKFPEQRRMDWPAYPTHVSDFSQLKRDTAFVAGFLLAAWAIAHWWEI